MKDMKLVCEKYKETMKSEEAVCRHPGEYCKFRNACIIHFMGKESKRQSDSTDNNAGEAQENETASG